MKITYYWIDSLYIVSKRVPWGEMTLGIGKTRAEALEKAFSRLELLLSK